MMFEQIVIDILEYSFITSQKNNFLVFYLLIYHCCYSFVYFQKNLDGYLTLNPWDNDIFVMAKEEKRMTKAPRSV